jgi:hypothetical protein
MDGIVVAYDGGGYEGVAAALSDVCGLGAPVVLKA